MPYIELEGESRGYSVTTDSISQTFVYRICNEDLDYTMEGATYDSFFEPNDDVALAHYVYATFPFYRVFPISLTENVVLYLTSHSATHQDGYWTVTLTYTVPPLAQASPSYIQFSIDLGGESYKISRSLEVRSSVARTGSALSPPDTERFIGVTKDAVGGADIIAKALNFSITTYVSAAVWSPTLLATYYNLIATYNNAAFYGFAAGEVLLLSASASGAQYRSVDVTFNFSAKPNLNAVADAPFAALTALGHDIIDYMQVKATSNDFPVQIPKYRKVHRVYDPGNFNLLGI